MDMKSLIDKLENLKAKDLPLHTAWNVAICRCIDVVEQHANHQNIEDRSVQNAEAPAVSESNIPEAAGNINSTLIAIIKNYERFEELRAKIPTLVHPEAAKLSEIYDEMLGCLMPFIDYYKQQQEFKRCDISVKTAWQEYEIIRQVLEGLLKNFSWDGDTEKVEFTANERCYYSDVVGRDKWPNPFERPMKRKVRDNICRELVASWMMLNGFATGHGDNIEDLLKELEEQLATPKREYSIGDWLPIATLPDGGTEVVEILMSGGTICRSPGIDREETPRHIKAELAEQGYWPNHKEFTPTHWRRITLIEGQS